LTESNTTQLSIKLHKYQTRIFESTSRFKALIAGVQSGKTVCGALWLGVRALSMQNKNHLIAAPTYKILSQSTLPKFFELWPTLLKYYKKQDGVIDLPGGGKIFIRSTENPVGLEGMTLKSAWLDEAGQMKSMAWIVLQARLAIEMGEAMLTTTPYSMNWVRNDFVKQFESGNKSYDVISFSSIDSPYFPKEEYERMKQTLSEEMFDMRYRGIFRKFSGLVYRDFDRNVHVIDVKLKPGWALYRSIDWGYNDPFCCLWIAVDFDSNVYIYREHYEAEQPTDYHAEMIKALSFGEKYKWSLGDSANPQMIKDMMVKGIEVQACIKGPGSIQAGIEQVRNFLQVRANGKPRLFVDKNCINTIDGVENYRYPEDSRDDKNKSDLPEDYFNHACFTKDVKVLTDNGEVPIYKIKKGDRVRTPFGVSKVLECGKTGHSKVFRFGNGGITGSHKIFTQRGLVRFDALRYNDYVCKLNQRKSLLMGSVSEGIHNRRRWSLESILCVLRRLRQAIEQNDYIDIFGGNIMVKFLRVIIFIIKIIIFLIMNWIIWNWYQLKNMLKDTTRRCFRLLRKTLNMLENLQASGMVPKKVLNSIKGLAKWLGKIKNITQKFVRSVEKNLKHHFQKEQSIVIEERVGIIADRQHLGEEEDVYNLKTEYGMYFANGILVSNCDCTRYFIHKFATPRKDSIKKQISEPLSPREIRIKNSKKGTNRFSDMYKM